MTSNCAQRQRLHARAEQARLYCDQRRQMVLIENVRCVRVCRTADVLECKHALAHTHTHTQARALTHMRMRARTHACAYARAHAHTHTHTHAHTRSRAEPCGQQARVHDKRGWNTQTMIGQKCSPRAAGRTAMAPSWRQPQRSRWCSRAAASAVLRPCPVNPPATARSVRWCVVSARLRSRSCCG